MFVYFLIYEMILDGLMKLLIFPNAWIAVLN